jgi:hypothetical protein
MLSHVGDSITYNPAITSHFSGIRCTWILIGLFMALHAPLRVRFEHPSVNSASESIYQVCAPELQV